ncbi:kinesin-8, putative [Plasmodium malariae]|uniref:Kinesin-like protein KIN-8B n=1 Tax=Plasmodium malariae TaxID=5858 RepID=A0A1D3JKK2_PLAMA|nr:kinesin-8, putative [Plasmodium malariae]SBT87085.1 kinesin-8, putative [Plasmodium malariae]
MEDTNGKRINAYDENEWMQKEESNISKSTSFDIPSASKLAEGICISNRTTENENEYENNNEKASGKDSINGSVKGSEHGSETDGVNYIGDNNTYNDDEDDNINIHKHERIMGESFPSSHVSTSVSNSHMTRLQRVHLANIVEHSFNRNAYIEEVKEKESCTKLQDVMTYEDNNYFDEGAVIDSSSCAYNREQKKKKREIDDEDMIKIYINNVGGSDNGYLNNSSYNNRICNNRSCNNGGDIDCECEHSDFPGKYYDKSRLSPMYRNKASNMEDSFKEVKEEQNLSSVQDLLEDIKLFNSSMKSISDTNNNMSLQDEISKMYSQFASDNNLHSLSNFHIDSSPCNTIGKANNFKKSSFQYELHADAEAKREDQCEDSHQGRERQELEKGEEAEVEEAEVEEAEVEEAEVEEAEVEEAEVEEAEVEEAEVEEAEVEEVEVEEVEVEEIEVEEGEAEEIVEDVEKRDKLKSASNKYDKRDDVKNVSGASRENKMYSSKRGIQECISNKMTNDYLNEEVAKYRTNVHNDQGNNTKLYMSDMSPLNLKKSETNVISSNQWEKMKKSFCDIENNLLGLGKEKQQFREKSIAQAHACANGNSNTHENIHTQTHAYNVFLMNKNNEDSARHNTFSGSTHEEYLVNDATSPINGTNSPMNETNSPMNENISPMNETNSLMNENISPMNEVSPLSDVSPHFNYLESNDAESLRYSNDLFPSIDYISLHTKCVSLTRRASNKSELTQDDTPNLSYTKCASPKETSYFSSGNSPNISFANNYETKANAQIQKDGFPTVVHPMKSKLTNLNLGKSSCNSPSINYSKEEEQEEDEEISTNLIKITNSELTKIDNSKISSSAKAKTPKNLSRPSSNKAVMMGTVKAIKIKSKGNENVKTPKMAKRNSNSSTTTTTTTTTSAVKTERKGSSSSPTAVVTATTPVSCVNAAGGGSPTNIAGVVGKAQKNEKSSPSGERDVTYNMNVVIRCRPMSVSEKNEGAKNIIKILDNKMVVLLDPSDNSDNVLRQNRSREKKYVFDYVFDENCSQEDVYNNSVKCLIDAVIKGYNSTVFAYGATGAGKTHTIIGYKNEPGIMMMILKDLFEKIKSLQVMHEYKVKCSFIEIYNENICDLLNPSNEYLDLREDPIKGVTVSNIYEVSTTSVEEIMELIHTGNRNRTQEPTDANKTSSRSHGVLQVIVEETEKGQGVYQQTKRGKLCVIDLAGSERASQTNNKGMRMLEGANINRSLLALGNVINALVLRSKGTSKSNFIPFRDSKLTRLLKDSLGGNCKTVMIANISPSHLSYEDTHNTLKYANRAKNIKNVVTSNAIVVKHHLSMYIDLIEKLKNEIEFLKEQLNEKDKMNEYYMSTSSTNYDYYDHLKEYEKNCSKEELINIISVLKRENQKLRNSDGNDVQNGGNHSGVAHNGVAHNGVAHNGVARNGEAHNGEAHGQNCNNITANEYQEEELYRYKEEVNSLKLLNEKLFTDNKSFQAKLQEYLQVSQNLKSLNDEYKKQIDGFKVLIYNHDINHIQIKKKLDDLKKKYAQLKESTEDKENDDTSEKWKYDLTKLLNERKKIKMIILDLERKLIEDKEININKYSDEDIKLLRESKASLDQQLKMNISKTNDIIKELPNKVKDEKMKNFLYLFYTNKVLLQDKEELQEFLELSSTIISQKEKQINELKQQLKATS